MRKHETMSRSLLPLLLVVDAAVAQQGGAPPPVQILEQAVPAQSPAALAAAKWLAEGPVAQPKWTFWLVTSAAALRNQRGQLEDLQRRFGEAGVRIAVALSADDGKTVAAGKPMFAVASLEPQNLLGSCWLAAGGERPAPAALDAAADALQAAVDGGAPARVLAQAWQLEMLLGQVADGGDHRTQAAKLVAALPRSGHARAVAVLTEWWGVGDPAAARRQAEAGLQALAHEPWALVAFADLVLRGDRNDAALAARIGEALQPFAAARPDTPFVQLVRLRALLRAGDDRRAGRMLSGLGKLCEGSARDQIYYAETLMEAADGTPWRPLAERALDAAGAAGADPRWLLAARYKVLVHSGAADEAERLLAEFRKTAGIAGGSLNNDAWYMMVQPETMGRFDDYALGQCREMQRQQGAAISFGEQDTCALALFLCGRIQAAIDLQTQALAQAQGRANYAERLRRYQQTLAARTGK